MRSSPTVGPPSVQPSQDVEPGRRAAARLWRSGQIETALPERLTLSPGCGPAPARIDPMDWDEAYLELRGLSEGRGDAARAGAVDS